MKRSGATFRVEHITVETFRFDDTTASEVTQKGNASNAQGLTDELIEWSRDNRVVLNPDKCKELRISFARNPEAFDPVSIDGNEYLKVVNSARLLGINYKRQLNLERPC